MPSPLTEVERPLARRGTTTPSDHSEGVSCFADRFVQGYRVVTAYPTVPRANRPRWRAVRPRASRPGRRRPRASAASETCRLRQTRSGVQQRLHVRQEHPESVLTAVHRYPDAAPLAGSSHVRAVHERGRRRQPADTVLDGSPVPTYRKQARAASPAPDLGQVSTSLGSHPTRASHTFGRQRRSEHSEARSLRQLAQSIEGGIPL